MRRVVVAIAVILAGCSSAPRETARTTAAPTTSSTTTTTTTTNPMQAARVRYFEITAVSNPKTQAADHKYRDSDGVIPWAKGPAWCGELAALDQAFLTALRSYQWPAEVQPAVDDVTKATAATAGEFFSCSHQTPGQLEARGDIGPSDEMIEASNAASSQLRAALGLPIDR